MKNVMPAVEHVISYDHDHRRCCRHRTRCTCGWGSDSYAAFEDAKRAGEAHVRRARREDFDTMIARSSIGAAVADIKERGLDAHLVDLERELKRPWQRAPKKGVR